MEPITEGIKEMRQEKRLWKRTLLIEDNLSRSVRASQHFIGVGDDTFEPFAVTMHNLAGHELISSSFRAVDRPDSGEWKDQRIDAALALLEQEKSSNTDVVTAGSGYGGNIRFLKKLDEAQQSFAVEISSSQSVYLAEADTAMEGKGNSVARLAAQVANVSGWSHVTVTHPVSMQPISYATAHIGHVLLNQEIGGWLTVLQTGAILNSTRGAAYILSSEPDVSFDEILQVAGWVRWIKPFMRKQLRPDSKGIAAHNRQWSLRADHPAYIMERDLIHDLFAQPSRASVQPVRMMELFAGAGGMGLGFFMADSRPPVHLLYSGEVHPVYAETLRINHEVLAAHPENYGMLPAETKAVDLRSNEAREVTAEIAKKANGVDILIGGPPCQGFSSSNRNSWHGGNPHNMLIDTYLSYVADLQPKIFVMENVKGIVSAPKAGQEDAALSVLDYFAQQMSQAGYHVFPRLLDASHYGVPQRRNRCFIVGLRHDLGYDKGDFDSWGPYPKPTHGSGYEKRLVTVGDAFHDLPRIGNGESRARQNYIEPCSETLEQNPYLKIMRNGAEANVVTDHVTSRHAEYVIERYQKIPIGGNWQDIRKELTNYANAGRTHSNIYRRLDPSLPSVTIGHYRKSMLVHPDQDRGLSLREAARLQSFPDWFRFAGVVEGQQGGNDLGHKQQQLANAVCPLVTKALAENLFKLLHRG